MEDARTIEIDFSISAAKPGIPVLPLPLHQSSPATILQASLYFSSPPPQFPTHPAPILLDSSLHVLHGMPLSAAEKTQYVHGLSIKTRKIVSIQRWTASIFHTAHNAYISSICSNYVVFVALSGGKHEKVNEIWKRPGPRAIYSPSISLLLITGAGHEHTCSHRET